MPNIIKVCVILAEDVPLFSSADVAGAPLFGIGVEARGSDGFSKPSCLC